jgi:hypothetical protein
MFSGCFFLKSDPGYNFTGPLEEIAWYSANLMGGRSYGFRFLWEDTL